MSSVPGPSRDSSVAEAAEKSPQPGPSQVQPPPVEQDLFDEPKPGPSTTAADFDLEVFDSGSSCSLEDCWNKDPAPKIGPNRSKNRAKRHLSSSVIGKESRCSSPCTTSLKKCRGGCARTEAFRKTRNTEELNTNSDTSKPRKIYRVKQNQGLDYDVLLFSS